MGQARSQALRGSGLPVEFVPLPTGGKPRIAAILDAVRESGASVAGIINSDCSMIGYPGNIASSLAACLPGRAVLAWRLDVGGRAMLTTGRAAEIQNSTSWKITAPLRAATGLVHG